MKSGERTRWGLKRGNIDLSDRPVVKNKDGSFSTIKSASTSMKGRDGGKERREVLFPTVVDTKKWGPGTKASGKDAKIVPASAGADVAYTTKKNLGEFRTGRQAEIYSGVQHNIEAKKYTKEGVYKGAKNVWDEKRGMWREK